MLAGVIEAGGAAVDDLGVDLLERLVVDAQLLRRLRPHVHEHDVGRAHEIVRDCDTGGGLGIEGDVLLAAVDLHGHVGGQPHVLCRRIDLDDLRTELRQELAAPRPGHREPEVDGPYPRQRTGKLNRRRRCSGRRRRDRYRRRRGRLVPYFVGVLPPPRRARVHVPRSPMQTVKDTGLAQRAEFLVLDVDDGTFAHERGVGQHLFG